MSTTLATTQTASLAPALLARRELLSLDHALGFLAGRLRARTPLGAAEYLELNAFSREAYDERLKIAISVCDIYRDFFPRHYAASQSPIFSLRREQEFYVLCDRHLLPLGSDVEAEIARDLSFLLPCIPVRSVQTHTWAEGAFDLARIETVYKVAHVLSTRAGSDGWRRLAQMFALGDQLPAPPLGAVGWQLFAYACSVEESPLRFLPLAFEVSCYRTGNVYLDLPPGGSMGVEWSHRNVSQLFIARQRAGQIGACVAACDEWLSDAPRERIGRAVELWNRASEIEAQSGFAGVLVEDGQAIYVPELRGLYVQMEGR